MYQRKPAQERRIRAAFTHHAPTNQSQVDRYENIRRSCLDLGMLLTGLCPDSRELNSALKCLEEVQSWAIAAIARNE